MWIKVQDSAESNWAYKKNRIWDPNLFGLMAKCVIYKLFKLAKYFCPADETEEIGKEELTDFIQNSQLWIILSEDNKVK